MGLLFRNEIGFWERQSSGTIGTFWRSGNQCMHHGKILEEFGPTYVPLEHCGSIGTKGDVLLEHLEALEPTCNIVEVL